MKLSNEYRRKVDPMSRVTIPADIREALDIQCGDDVIVSLSAAAFLVWVINRFLDYFLPILYR